MTSAVVTGASARGGAAVARALHGHGLSVALHHSGQGLLAGLLADGLNALRPGSAQAWACSFRRPQDLDLRPLEALQSLVLTLAVDWAPTVRCNMVQPGTLPYPADWTDKARRAAINASIPPALTGTFTELAQAVIGLALDAHYITGQVLAVDGGRSTWLP